MKQSLILSVLLCLSAVAQADIVGSWKVADNQNITLYYQDDNHIRMDVGHGSYMLIIGDKAYSVTNQGGQKMVMDMAAMGSAMKAFGGSAIKQAEDKAKQYDPDSVSYKKTGKQETIAGYKGSVYKMSVKGPKGVETEEFVASQDKDVVLLQKAFMTMSQRMAQSVMGKDSMESFNRAADMAEAKNMGGMLRYGKQMVLQSLENKDLPDSTYAIPKDAMMMNIPSFGR